MIYIWELTQIPMGICNGSIFQWKIQKKLKLNLIFFDLEKDILFISEEWNPMLEVESVRTNGKREERI